MEYISQKVSICNIWTVCSCSVRLSVYICQLYRHYIYPSVLLSVCPSRSLIIFEKSNNFKNTNRNKMEPQLGEWSLKAPPPPLTHFILEVVSNDSSVYTYTLNFKQNLV